MAKLVAGSLCPVCRQKDPFSTYKVTEIQSDATKTTFYCGTCKTQFPVASDLAEIAPVVAVAAGAAALITALGKLLSDDKDKN